MKKTQVTSGTNNYTNLRFRTEAQAKFTRSILRAQLSNAKVDPYYEAKRTVRVYA